MDPVSAITGALAAVVQAVDFGLMMYGLIEGARSTPEHVQRLSVELRGLYSVLVLLSGSLESQKSKVHQEGFPVHMVNNVTEIVGGCLELFYEIKKTLKPYLESDGRANMMLSFKKGLKFEVVKKEHVESLRVSLSHNKATLELAITTMNLYVGLRLFRKQTY
jgi:hypothetical protein